jgi:predicted metal-dependent hydrolase/CheY-like chemotaxis protein
MTDLPMIPPTLDAAPAPRPAGPPILALVADLLFATRIADVVRQQGGEPVLAATVAEFRQGLERWPALILLDLHAIPLTEALPEVLRLKTLPQTRSIPLYAFGSHVDADALKAARQAGCDHVWARSRFAKELPQLVASAIDPPVVYLTGWDDRPSAAFLQGVALFNAGEYYRQHDIFEQQWMEDQRPIRELYQGVLQIGVALHQVENGNYRGAVKMLRRGLLRLRTLPPVCQTLDVAALRRDARSLHDQLIDLGPARMGQLLPTRLHALTLRLVEP